MEDTVRRLTSGSEAECRGPGMVPGEILRPRRTEVSPAPLVQVSGGGHGQQLTVQRRDGAEPDPSLGLWPPLEVITKPQGTWTCSRSRLVFCSLLSMIKC